MFDRLLPQPIDNRYSGSKIALWLFGLIVFVQIIQSVLVIVNGYSTAQSADGIPLETYPAAAAQTILALFIISSLRRLLISLICAVVLFRYRSAVPLMFVVLGLNYLGGQVILQFVPIVRVGTPPGVIMTLIMFGLTVVGLALSLWSRGGSHPAGSRTRAV
jgi:glucan phosphoethanolaminetransferase (alkaline phosphatase superfamily)